MKNVIYLLFFWVIGSSFSISAQSAQYRNTIDLSGEWQFALDSLNQGVLQDYPNHFLDDKVLLPGTTDTNRKGKPNTNRSETTQLSRYYTYVGPAWYSKEVTIPKDWKNRKISLFLERTRPSTLWVDGVLIDSCAYLSSPHQYDLSEVLTPGKHRLTLRVDNGESIPSQIRSSSHACTESTQTNWNGIIGRLELQATNSLSIEAIRLYPMVEDRAVKAVVTLSQEQKLKGKRLRLQASAFNTEQMHDVEPLEISLQNGQRIYEVVYPLTDSIKLWSEYDPALYRLTATIPGIDEVSEIFGMRHFSVIDKQFAINGQTTFLRGKHDACVFPLTGHTAMDKDEWRRYFRICKEYGLNHCRFHSWCPPKACFEAADLEGIYLQPELPIWGAFSKDTPELMDFLKADGEQLLKSYSNHPSFVMFALGNELWGEKALLAEFVDHFRAVEPRHHYAYGSNIYLGWEGHLPGEDFLVTCRVGGGEGYSTHARASFSFADAEEGGYLNNTYPNTKMNFDNALVHSPVPVIGHETGQFQIYPNYKEMDKYTGVLAPWNFEEFQRRLHEKGMGGQAEDFLKASGAWSVELYRADIEMNLRTAKMAGFQLLDLQDYPGQGSAYVGVLDAFMDSKDLIGPQEWRQFCSAVVPLLTMSRYCWSSRDTLRVDVQLANYGNQFLAGKFMRWALQIDDRTLNAGELVIPSGRGLLGVGTLELPLSDVEGATKAILTLQVEDTEYTNSYPLWIYPEQIQPLWGDVYLSSELDEKTMGALAAGGRVLLIPQADSCRDVTMGALFQTDYWNYRMFKTICQNANKPVSPGTLGLLTDPQHPIFASFPTESHTNWQWYPLLKVSYPLILDELSNQYLPIVQIIDNVERNHKLGLIFEFNIAGGRLLVCMADLLQTTNTPEGKQLLCSLLDYMNSAAFHPTCNMDKDQLEHLFLPAVRQEEIKTLHNISYD